MVVCDRVGDLERMVHPDDEDVSKAVSNLRRQVETFRFKLEASLPRPGERAKFSSQANCMAFLSNHILATSFKIGSKRHLALWFLSPGNLTTSFSCTFPPRSNRIENPIRFHCLARRLDELMVGAFDANLFYFDPSFGTKQKEIGID